MSVTQNMRHGKPIINWHTRLNNTYFNYFHSLSRKHHSLVVSTPGYKSRGRAFDPWSRRSLFSFLPARMSVIYLACGYSMSAGYWIHVSKILGICTISVLWYRNPNKKLSMLNEIFYVCTSMKPLAQRA